MVSQQRQRLLEKQSAQQLKTTFGKQQVIKAEKQQTRLLQEEIRKEQEEQLKPVKELINNTQSQLSSVNKQIEQLVAEKQSYYDRGASSSTRVRELNNLIDSLATQRNTLSASISALQSSTNIQEAQAKVQQVQQQAYYQERASLLSSIAQKEQKKLKEQAKLGNIANVQYNKEGNIISYEIPAQKQAGITEQVKSGKDYGADFVGPIRPEDTRATPTTTTKKVEVGQVLVKPSEVGSVKSGIEYEVVGKGMDVLTTGGKIKTVNIGYSDLVPTGSIQTGEIISPAKVETTKGVNIQQPNIIQENTLVGDWMGVSSDNIGITYPKGQEPIISQQTKESIVSNIRGAEQFVVESIFPEEKEQRLQQEAISRQYEDLGNRIESFNKKYEGKELTTEEYNKALIEQSNLQSELESLQGYEEQRKQDIYEQDIGNIGEDFFGFGGSVIGIGIPTGATSFGKGVIKGAIKEIPESIIYGIDLITAPVETIEGTITSIKSIPDVIASEPFGATGEIVGGIGVDILLGKLGKKATIKASDIIRTRGLKELDVLDVIAPEYIKGQRFPTIKKGQTAGELLAEFKYADDLTGFTASPKPFGKITKAGKGTSELAGVYQAPKVSPAFLRITKGERKLFTLDFFDETLRPTITKITPDDFELTPFVKEGQRALAPLKETKEFFLERAEKGKSYVPFIKTEKEAVIPFDTELRQVGKKGYIKFEGRRIPIFEFEALSPTESLGLLDTEITTARKVYDISSSSKIGKKAYLSSSDLLESVSITPSSLKSLEPVSALSLVSEPSQKPVSKVSVSRVSIPKPSKISSVVSPSDISFKSDIPSNLVSPRVSPPSSPSISPPYAEPPIYPQPRKLKLRTYPKPKQEKKIKQEAYNVYVKVPKKKSYSKITKKPLSRRDAENLRAFALDESTSRQGYIKRVKTKPSKLPYDIPPTYYQDTDFKFRKFKQEKGKKVPLINRVIEKSKYIQDTRNEKKDLSVFRTLARVEKKKLNKINKPFGLGFA